MCLFSFDHRHLFLIFFLFFDMRYKFPICFRAKQVRYILACVPSVDLFIIYLYFASNQLENWKCGSSVAAQWLRDTDTRRCSPMCNSSNIRIRFLADLCQNIDDMLTVIQIEWQNNWILYSSAHIVQWFCIGWRTVKELPSIIPFRG